MFDAPTDDDLAIDLEAELHKLEETFFVTSFEQRLAWLAKAAIRRALTAERQLRLQAKKE